MIPSNEGVYLDANSLIAYLVPNHQDHVSMSKTMAQLLIGRNTLYFSPLSVDEMMMGIIRIYRAGGSQPPSDFYIEVKRAVNTILSHKQMVLRQFETSLKQGTLNAVENVKDYILRPRDAFHLAYMTDWNIKYVVTKDNDFTKVTSITKITY